MKIIAFDFSCAKPACCINLEGCVHYFCWPQKLDQESQRKLESCGVTVRNRNLEPLSKKHGDLVMEHLKRAEALADMIVRDIDMFLVSHGHYNDRDFIIANEGFSFGSSGDATLNLAGYKYLLLHKLKEAGFTDFRTFSPITIKSTAGCAKKGMSKKDMIEAAASSDIFTSRFSLTLRNSPQALKKKTAFIDCIDDLCDAYWCMRTVEKKENKNND